eukprot:931307_1
MGCKDIVMTSCLSGNTRRSHPTSSSDLVIFESRNLVIFESRMMSLFTLIAIVLGPHAQPILTLGRSNEFDKITYEAKPIIYHDDTKYYADDNSLNFLSTSEGPYKIISVMGQARKGKSTTLNSVISELIDVDVSPFSTSNGIDPCTQGIWMYIVPKCACNAHKDQCDQKRGERYCIHSDYSFILLDIEGSDTAKNDIALRYASIATLLSSKIFLFAHESLYAHDIDHINDIETFRTAMSNQNINFPFDELDLGIIIREPLGALVGGKFTEKINELFQEFSGINLNESSSLLDSKLPVFALDSLDNHRNYKRGIKSVSDFIKNEQNYKASTNKVQFGLLTADKIIEFIHGIVETMNENEDLNAICIGCVYTKIIEWNPWGEWSVCSKECGGGIAERKRSCNTGRDYDCSKFRHGSAVHQRDCNQFGCELLKWNEWYPWSQCDKECNGGTQTRFRECGTGNDKHCQNKFGDSKREERECNAHPCGWNSWSECSQDCGGGTQVRHKECETRHKECEHTNTEERPCNTHSCFNVYYLLGIMDLAK